MDKGWLLRLDPTSSSYSLLGGLVLVVLVVGILYQSGFIGWALGLFSRVTLWMIRRGFRFWERWLSWADWGVYLLITLGLLLVGGLLAGIRPEISLLCALTTLIMGTATCLAYVFIDLERYEVERGHKAVHNPTKGQNLAPNLARYGHQVGMFLLIAAAVGAIGGFALLNQGLYETIGEHWYQVNDASRPIFVDFLAYALINLLSIVDVLDLADSHRLVHTAFVRKAAWPAAVMLATFRSFFTIVLLQQVFASIRQGKLLAETIADFWSPHEPIHDRARSALPQFGASAIGPLLVSLREMTALTKEQRDRLPQLLAVIGPSTIPTLVLHLQDPHEHVRAVAASALGHLGAREVVAEVAALVADPSDQVRLSAADALGRIAAAGARAERSRKVRMPCTRRARVQTPRSIAPIDPTITAVNALRLALADNLAAIRCQAALSLGRAGAAGVSAAETLTELLRDPDETVRCQAAESLGQVGGPAAGLVAALDDPAPTVRVAAMRGLKLLGPAAMEAGSKLVALLQDRDESVRAAAAEAVAATGSLDHASTSKLAEGLTSLDTVARAQAAEALGSVGAVASIAAPPLIEAVGDHNDVVRAKAVEALGKIGESVAEVAVPSLVRALRDQDSRVSALAAEALGEMGQTDGKVVPALVRALGHVNPQVRANAAEALGKLGPAAVAARSVVERLTGDEDGGVRAQAIRALGGLGSPTPGSLQVVRSALADPDPLVRAAAVEAIGVWNLPAEEVVSDLLPLLRDPNDRVKSEVTEVLAKQGGATVPVVEGLCKVLAEDDSDWIQTCAAMALAQLGPTAVAAGPALLRAARTGEAGVREQAMRALVMIQPPEASEGFAAGLTDPVADVRMIASAGWIKATAVPEEVVPALVDALNDPEPQVRANVAHALARLDTLPPEAIVALRECASDPHDGLRLNAALALQLVPPADVADVMEHLLDDPHVRIRLLAAQPLLKADPGNLRAAAVVNAALEDPSPRVREAAEELTKLIAVKAPEVPADGTPAETVEKADASAPTDGTPVVPVGALTIP